MTITAQTPRSGPYSGDGSTVAFSYTFLIDSDAEVVVVVANVDGVETTQTLTTDYTVSGIGSQSGGTITFVTAPAATETVSMRRATVQDQSTDLQNRGAVFPEVLENDLDEVVKMVQDVQEQADRALASSVTSGATGVTLPAPSSDQYLAWNNAGTALVNKDLVTDGAIGLPVSISEGGTAATTASSARSSLGVSIGSDVQAHDALLDTLSASVVTALTGADTNIVTGTAGTAGDFAEWDANGDLVGSGTTVGEEVAALAAGAVGTYAMCARSLSGTDYAPGSTIAGSLLYPVSVVTGGTNFAAISGSIFLNTAATLSGTWRCMAPLDAASTSGGTLNGAGLFLRIS